MRAWCRWCRYRIRWYARWEAWGTATGDQEHATRCPERAANDPVIYEGTENLRHLHEPVEEKPGG